MNSRGEDGKGEQIRGEDEKRRERMDGRREVGRGGGVGYSWEKPLRSQPSLQPLLPVRHNKLNLSSFGGSLRPLNSVLVALLIKAVTANLLKRGWGWVVLGFML